VKNTRHLLLLITITTMLIGCTGQPAATEPPDQPSAATPIPQPESSFTAENPARIVRLDSYHESYLWSISLYEGLQRGLAEGGYSMAAENIDIQPFFMDTKRNADSAYFEAIAQEALTFIREQQPDVVVANDNNAVRLVIQPLLDDGIPIVFAGLNDEPEIYGLADNPNVTGVLERAHVAETFRWIERVFPEAQHITCILDDSVTTASYLSVVEAALSESRFAEQSSIELISTLTDWQAAVMAAGDTSEAIVIGTYHTLRDENDDPVHEDDVMAWMVANSPLPLVPFWEFSIEQGALGGSVISGDLQGYEAGRLAAQILNGAQAGDLPIVTPARGKLIVNPEAMTRWEVQIPLNLLEISAVYSMQDTP
jgi:ABC-type uncharacterized transport system substrate-binding protein